VFDPACIITVTDAMGCVVSMIDTNKAENISIQFEPVAETNCQRNSMIIAHATGGTPPYTFEWWDYYDVTGDTLTNIPEPLYAGYELLTVTDKVGCEVQNTYYIN